MSKLMQAINNAGSTLFLAVLQHDAQMCNVRFKNILNT